MKVEVIDLTPPDADLDSGVRPLLRRLIVRAATSEGLRARVFRGTAWSLLGTVVLQGCAMLASVGAARILGQAAFGGFGMIRSTVMTFGILAGTGLGIAATKLVAEHRTSDPVRGGGTIFFRRR
jgi:O-antigen/teichoic acid export membrane protein